MCCLLAMRMKEVPDEKNYLDIECCVVNFLELCPVMELLLVPQPFVFLDIKVIHTRLTYFFVGRASLESFALVIIINDKIIVPQSSVSRQAKANIC